MKKLLGIIALSIVTAGIGVGASRRASASAYCHNVNGRFIVDITQDGCTSPVGLCTAGYIAGAGPLNGTTTAVLQEVSPGAGMHTVAPSTLSYTSTWQLVTPQGTATFNDLGLFDTAGGRTTSISTLLSGTGKFDGATGTIYLNGWGQGHLEANISGQVCFAGEAGND